MRWDSLWAGLIAGLLAPVLGFFLHGLVHTTWVRPQVGMHEYIHDIFLGRVDNQAPIISLSLIANLGAFFIFDRLGMHKAMRGVVTATFLYGIVIVVLWM